MRKSLMLAVAAALTLSGCGSLAGGSIDRGVYSLIRVKPTSVGNGSLVVTPPRQFNKQRRLFFDSIRWVEDWTQHGPLLDGITFVTGLPGGEYLVRQRRSDERQVPKFRSDMTAPEVAAMLESAYRVRGGAVDFETLGLQPRQFAGYPGFQFDYQHLDTDELWRKGRAVGAVINGRLYLVLLDAARSHYYDETIRDFEAIVASARLKR